MQLYKGFEIIYCGYLVTSTVCSNWADLGIVFSSVSQDEIWITEMRVWINKRSVGLVQSVNIKEGRFCCFTVENIRLYTVATSSKFCNYGRPAIISADCCPAILQHFDLNSRRWILRCCEAKNWICDLTWGDPSDIAGSTVKVTPGSIRPGAK